MRRLLFPAFLVSAGAFAQQPFAPDAIQFFEMKVRPVLHANCTGCHNDRKPANGLSLENRAAILAGGNSGPAAVSGNAGESRLIRAIEQSAELKMPPGGAKLKPEQIADLRHWVELGLPWPDAPVSKAAEPVRSNHWAFQPPKHYPEPAVKNTAWSRNAIDRFVLARLETEKLKPSPEANRETLIRRLSLDLIGLPPTPAEVDAFVTDKNTDAYERVVDRLLASPHYGERWGRHWLDAARYADTNGYGFDNTRVMWRYRDWVIQALNQDMPFDRFTIEQLAGDMLPKATTPQKIATGFHRNTMINTEGGTDQEQYRVEAIVDRVSTTSGVFLGLTLGCAQCHDHKYDPLTQREFYRMFAFFNNQDEPVMKVVSAQESSRYMRTAAGFEAEKLKLQSAVAARAAELVESVPAWEAGLTPAARAKVPGNVVEILKIPASQRELSQAEEVEKYIQEQDAEYQRRFSALELFTGTPSNRNPNQYTAMVLEERDKPRKTHVMIRGDFLKLGVEVTPGTPAVLPAIPPGAPANRLTLAKWLVDPSNPLTARVTMNRVWQHYFGRGLVKTSEDFGSQGDKPSHPELLDWLATEFIGRHWSLKSMHRLIVTSATYRQSSTVTPELAERDPENILLARSPRYRVEGEVVRDIALAASGLLNPEVGGPSVFPPQPAGVTDLSRGNMPWIVETGKNRYRRGLYTFWKRTSPYPGLTIFDAPTAEQMTLRRNRSNSPMQALTTLNDEVFVETAQALALRVLRDVPSDDNARLRYAFKLCLSRDPDAGERDTLSTTLARRIDPAQAREILPANAPAGMDPAKYAAWFGLSRILLNLDETITRE